LPLMVPRNRKTRISTFHRHPALLPSRSMKGFLVSDITRFCKIRCVTFDAQRRYHHVVVFFLKILWCLKSIESQVRFDDQFRLWNLRFCELGHVVVAASGGIYLDCDSLVRCRFMFAQRIFLLVSPSSPDQIHLKMSVFHFFVRRSFVAYETSRKETRML